MEIEKSYTYVKMCFQTTLSKTTEFPGIYALFLPQTPTKNSCERGGTLDLLC